ncbi:hypothetical protein I7I50_10391 [Histoplasma capsulatum G186AR]|uniref:Uncharacterized protein n=1 Tax=Ajellomyces capsulatus TaxID=5037 RepID=A0A8H7Z7J1_AJECA|nr:hypothetical protein I7I52_01630 [Histoplasma capsulatum]QSS69190.1 hypothetical protein I7I50_10391 [Histoplasma capsulatum G186AR]
MPPWIKVFKERMDSFCSHAPLAATPQVIVYCYCICHVRSTANHALSPFPQAMHRRNEPS